MLKTFRVLCLAVGVAGMLAFSAVAAESPATDLDGRQWAMSTPEEKLAFLYGVSSAIGVEQAIATHNKATPSIFVQNWMKAFGNSTLSDVREKLDAWYKANPEGKNRHVFDVMWYELIAPGTK